MPVKTRWYTHFSAGPSGPFLTLSFPTKRAAQNYIRESVQYGDPGTVTLQEA